ncbi:MAG: YqgE/AlgH family protein [Bacteroidales bacterium]|nr:YqgE/AlgH family protein [Bacteroidales bacterium]
MRIQDLIIKHNALKPEKGRILISEPFMIGEPFERSVVLLCEKGDQGHLGFVLNKPIGFFLDEVMTIEGKIPKIPIYLGGPVAAKRLFYLHTLGTEIQGAIPINDKLYMDGDLDQLIARLSKDESLSKNVRFFVGYSGWTEGQLEAEIRDDAWMVSKINPKEVFKLCEDSSKMWKKYLQQLGEKYRVWSTYPLIPELN